MQKFLRYTSIFFLLLGAVYLLGPRVERPVLDHPAPEVPEDIKELDAWVKAQEKAFPNIKPGNASVIHFADSVPQKTPYSVVYLHGFSASHEEGAPVHKQVADVFGANLYLPRLAGHGLEEEETLMSFSGTNYLDSAKAALEVGKAIGDSLVVLATSSGATLALTLAQEPKIAALLLYSPNIQVADPAVKLLSKPWGLQLARLVKGGKYHLMNNPSELKKQFWSTKYRLEGITHLQRLMDQTMRKSTFKKVTQPVFMGYYYKNEQEQDPVVSVPAMLRMFDHLGTPKAKKVKQAFPEANEHVITSYISTQVYDRVAEASIDFLSEVVGMNPVQRGDE
ncbi:MAG: alpha/beta hydrolase [Flavobacteriaceae bacterium]